MSPERQLAELIAHPWTKCEEGNKTYFGAECQVRYAMKANQLAAVCELHRRTPATRDLMELNGFKKGSCSEYCWSYYLNDTYSLWFHKEDVPLLMYSDAEIDSFATLMKCHTVADLENLLDLLEIDKQIKLPKSNAERVKSAVDNYANDVIDNLMWTPDKDGTWP